MRYAVGRIEATFPDASLAPAERVLQLARNRVRVLGSDPGLAWLLRSDQAYLTMPEGAVGELRALVVRTRKYLLDAIREGGVDGTIRNDIEPEILVLTVTGTIHALIGLTGLHRHATSARRPDPERVISGLSRLISPPAAPASNPKQKPRGRTRRKK